MKKGLFLIILIGIFLGFLLPGETRGNREKKPSLPELLSLAERGGVRVDGFELEGWAVFRQKGEVDQIWKDLDLPAQLGISKGNISLARAPQDKRVRFQGCPPGGAVVQITLQQVSQGSKQDLCYVMIKVRVPSGAQTPLAWEGKLRKALVSLDSEYGLYITVKGRIPRKLEPDIQLAWGQAVFRALGGSVASSLRTKKYLSLAGYTPVFPDAVRVRKKRVNFNVALTSPAASNETFVYLGTPLISSEY